MKQQLRGPGMAFCAAILALVSAPAGRTEGANGMTATPDQVPVYAPAASSTACASPTALCLSNGRFAVEAAWKTPDGAEGLGHPVPLISDSGYFWFFDPSNVELAVKTLNGCGINGHSWFFAGGMTNVEVTLTVTDTVSGLTHTYTNPQGQVFQPITDTGAFETCSDADAALSTRNPEEPPEGFSAASPRRPFTAARAPEIGCLPSDTALCIRGRFQIEATWQTASGASGPAHAVALTPEAGYFWFFEPSNLELITKTLDACSIGGGQWFFAAGLTNVGVEMEVTDTFTGEHRTYSSPLGTPFLPVQDTGAFSFCPTPTPTPTATPSPTQRPRSATPTLTPPRVGYGAKTFDVRLVTQKCLNPRIVPEKVEIYHTDTIRWTAGDCGHHLHSDYGAGWDAILQPGSTYERKFSPPVPPFPITVSYSCTTHGERGTLIVRWNPRYLMP